MQHLEAENCIYSERGFSAAKSSKGHMFICNEKEKYASGTDTQGTAASPQGGAGVSVRRCRLTAFTTFPGLHP